MLFLLNSTVVSVSSTVSLPKGLERLTLLSGKGVIDAGCELFQAHPRLEIEKPDMAQWFSALVMMKFPSATGALFAQAEGAKGLFARIADVPLPVIARIWQWQRDGVAIRDDVFRDAWACARAVA